MLVLYLYKAYHIKIELPGQIHMNQKVCLILGFFPAANPEHPTSLRLVKAKDKSFFWLGNIILLLYFMGKIYLFFPSPPPINK